MEGHDSSGQELGDGGSGARPKDHRVPAALKGGGNYCAAVNCHNCQKRDQPRGIQFYRFPAAPERRHRWLVRVNRREPTGNLWKPGSSARLCSAHFVSGKKSDDPNDVDFVPSVFPTGHVRERHDAERAERMRRRSQVSQVAAPLDETFELDLEANPISMINVNVAQHTFDRAVQTPRKFPTSSSSLDKELIVLSGSICDLISATEKCLQVSTPSKSFQSALVPKQKDANTNTLESRVKDDRTEGEKEKDMTLQRMRRPKLFLLDLKDDQFSSFTGVTRQQLQFFVLRIGQKLQDVPTMSREMCVALVLVKMKTDMSYLNLSAMFGIDKSKVKPHFVKAFWPLYEVCKDLVIWYSRRTIQARMPASFKGLFPQTRAIIDASEVECTRPPTPTMRVKMYSQYKSR